MRAESFYVRGKRVVRPLGTLACAFRVSGGKICEFIDFNQVPEGAPLLDAGSLYVIPGLVDTHVHINDPGRESWEGFETASKAAAAGGVTTLMDMPLNSIPSTVNSQAIHSKKKALEDRSWVDVGLCGGLVPENSNNVGDLFKEGLLAFKCFLADSGVNEFSHVNAKELEDGMRSLARVDAPLLVHAELPEPLLDAQRRLEEGRVLSKRSYDSWLLARPKSAEDQAIHLVYNTVKNTGARAHIVHLSSSSALGLLRRAKDENLSLTAETCPHYLTFAAEEIPEGATEYKCAPPIREIENRELLWGGLKEGFLSQVVTDHSPSTLELKCSDSGDFTKAWGGIASLQIGLAAVWSEARARGASFEDVVRWMCEMPAKLVGIYGKKGALLEGADADFVFLDPEKQIQVDKDKLAHKNKVTPYHGRTLYGVVEKTYLRGECVYDAGKWRGHPSGRFLSRT